MYTLSVVSIVNDADLQNVNAFAELCRCGPNNLSVKLQDSNGNIFWGCHSFWKPEDFQTFSTIAIPDIYQASMANLYNRAVEDGDAQSNWASALLELGLTVVNY